MAKIPKVPGTSAPAAAAPEPVIEEVPEPIFQPPVELVVHNASMAVRTIPTPDGIVTVAQFMTPIGLMVSLKFDESGVDAFIQKLRGSDIVLPGKQIIIP